jgi:hypothetical protein
LYVFFDLLNCAAFGLTCGRAQPGPKHSDQEVSPANELLIDDLLCAIAHSRCCIRFPCDGQQDGPPILGVHRVPPMNDFTGGSALNSDISR